MNKRIFLPSLLSVLLILNASAQSKPVIKVDINFAGRQDAEVLEPGYTAWAPGKDIYSTETTIDGITFTITTADHQMFRNDWNKAFVQNADYKAKNGRLTGDGIVLDPITETGAFILSIKGLPAGQHTLQAYHNSKDDPAKTDVRPMNVWLGDLLVCENLKPTIQEPVAANAALSKVVFNVAKAGDEVVITYSTKDSTLKDPVTDKATIVRSPILNGFELNTASVAEQAKNPSPAAGDMHFDADGGSCTLRWQAASQGVTAHNLYMATDTTVLNQMTMPTASLSDTCYVVEGLSTHHVYYWRVDEVGEGGTVTPGQVWSFRPRRLAFPGAEGYGRYAIGGRGGVVYHVTNLKNDHQPGSFLYGLVDLTGPRTIVFDVSGIIDMNYGSVFVPAYVTIAAQTAPGKGICLKHSNLNIGSDNICRFLRARRGYGDTGNAMGATGSDHTIIDHTTAAWGTDETFSSRGAKNLTFQYSMIAEALGIADHKNYDSGKNHGFAATIGGDIATFSHNYLANCQGRNWSLGGGLDGNGYYSGRLDIFNNLVYNWGGRATDGGAHEVNFVNNYYKVGPANGTKMLLNAQLEGTGKGSQSYYVSGNIRQEINNGKLTHDKEGDTYKYSLYSGQTLDWEVWQSQPFFPSYAVIHSACDAYKVVVSDAGATRPCRDNQHTRIQRETIGATYTYTGSRSGIKGQIDHENDCGGFEDFPEEHRPEGYDTDQDGMPDWYEALIGSDPLTANHNEDPDNDGYTLLEEYLEFLAHPYLVIASGEQQALDMQPEFKGFTQSPAFTVTAESSLFTASMSGSQLMVQALTSTGVGTLTVTCTDAEGSSWSQRVSVAVTEKASGLETPATGVAEGPCYNLLGQRVGPDYRGVVIQNGQKFVRR